MDAEDRERVAGAGAGGPAIGVETAIDGIRVRVSLEDLGGCAVGGAELRSGEKAGRRSAGEVLVGYWRSGGRGLSC